MIKKIKGLLHNPYNTAKKNGVEIPSNTILAYGFRIEKNGRNLSTNIIKIGEKCVLHCRLIFEANTGSISIGNGTYIGGGTNLISTSEIKIGNNVTIAWGVTIYDHDSHSLNYKERILDQERLLKDWSSGNFIATKDWSVVTKESIHISDYAWIGFDAVILKGVTIGKGAVVGARAVVAKDVEPWTVVAGNPARVIRRIDERWRSNE